MSIIISMLIIIAILLTGSFISYCVTFLVKGNTVSDPYVLFPGKQYAGLRERILELVSVADRISYEDVYTQSFDGLKLHARLYKTSPDSPVQIMFHGYRSHPLRDFSAPLPLALENGFNVLLVDQRAHGESEGHFLSLGIKERRDVQAWAEYASAHFGNDVPVILFGISMGAASVLLASALKLPHNVRGIVSDCAYSSPSEIVLTVMKARRQPILLLYPLLCLGGLIFGGFDIGSFSAAQAVKQTSIPILFIHGEADRFVPCGMSLKCADASASKSTLLTVPNAGHSLSYVVDEAAYKKALLDFFKSIDCM